MILDPSCPSSTRGPTVHTAHRLLGGLLLAGLLSGCAAAGATGNSAEESLQARSVVELETPQEVRAKDLPSAAAVAADAPEVEQIEAALEVQEAFVPSEEPVAEDPGNPQSSAELDAGEEPAELDPAAVAAAEESAAGAALQEIIASLAEFEHQGWEQRGTPVVVGKPVSAPLPTDEGEAVRVTVCLDSSGVSVVDRDGVVVSGEQKGRKALHNYDLFRQPGESWQVVQHGFPDDPTC
ncbi:hypothetical protein GMA12_04615 [Kocuria sediminis]|uniref:Uncharacterized protein n=1 Tax=Kocuria sediminis TaxID=1038857 RepID=A0A6N8GI62_9MICC|nr:hypothetical protein [Kocuria sediminis]MUN62429.1 hypothetical protein [Kocuria sediminis]